MLPIKARFTKQKSCQFMSCFRNLWRLQCPIAAMLPEQKTQQIYKQEQQFNSTTLELTIPNVDVSSGGIMKLLSNILWWRVDRVSNNIKLLLMKFTSQTGNLNQGYAKGLMTVDYGMQSIFDFAFLALSGIFRCSLPKVADANYLLSRSCQLYICNK